MKRPTDRFLTPPMIATRLGVSPEKIIGWITRGELRAIDVSERHGTGRARWRIDPADLELFLAARAAVASKKTERRRRRARPAEYVEYFR